MIDDDTSASETGPRLSFTVVDVVVNAANNRIRRLEAVANAADVLANAAERVVRGAGTTQRYEYLMAALAAYRAATARADGETA